MKRDIYQQLTQWKESPRRKPLVLNGARQVGKTYALQTFGNSHYEKVIHLNFERDKRLAKYFEDSLDPYAIMDSLSLHSETTIESGTTLLIFDEIQECPRAMTSLKYFCEEAPDYHVASAGSLLGVKTNHEQGFPVGKVNFIHLYPLSFFEFLVAIGNKQLREHLENISAFDPLAEPIHDKLIKLLKQYMYIGGMPEVVAEFVSSGSYDQVRLVQEEILASYERDFAKHAPSNQVMKIVAVWKQIHQQLAKENRKFIFSSIRKSARGRDYEEAIQWLLDAGLILKSSHVATPKLPISAYADTHIFKLFLLDIGLLGAQTHLAPRTIIEGNRMFTEFKGALTENFVAQELTCARQRELYYWTSAGTAEVDFIVEEGQEIYPLEVKAGVSKKKKSLLVYNQRYRPTTLSRANQRNLRQDGKIDNYPLYLVSKLPLKRS